MDAARLKTVPNMEVKEGRSEDVLTVLESITDNATPNMSARSTKSKAFFCSSTVLLAIAVGTVMVGFVSLGIVAAISPESLAADTVQQRTSEPPSSQTTEPTYAPSAAPIIEPTRSGMPTAAPTAAPRSSKTNAPNSAHSKAPHSPHTKAPHQVHTKTPHSTHTKAPHSPQSKAPHPSNTGSPVPRSRSALLEALPEVENRLFINPGELRMSEKRSADGEIFATFFANRDIFGHSLDTLALHARLPKLDDANMTDDTDLEVANQLFITVFELDPLRQVTRLASAHVGSTSYEFDWQNGSFLSIQFTDDASAVSDATRRLSYDPDLVFMTRPQVLGIDNTTAVSVSSWAKNVSVERYRITSTSGSPQEDLTLSVILSNEQGRFTLATTPDLDGVYSIPLPLLPIQDEEAAADNSTLTAFAQRSLKMVCSHLQAVRALLIANSVCSDIGDGNFSEGCNALLDSWVFACDLEYDTGRRQLQSGPGGGLPFDLLYDSYEDYLEKRFGLYGSPPPAPDSFIGEGVLLFPARVTSTPNPALNYETPDEPQCNDVNQAGGDLPDSKLIQMNSAGGEFEFRYQSYVQEDQFLIYQGSTLLFNSECLGTRTTLSTTVKMRPELNTNKIRVTVVPNCNGGSGTAWVYTVRCDRFGELECPNGVTNRYEPCVCVDQDDNEYPSSQLLGPDPNGCGSPNSRFFLDPSVLTPIILPRTWGPQFIISCNIHDICWGTCGSTIGDCDDALLEGWDAGCDQAEDVFDEAFCRSTALAMAGVLLTGGPYIFAQVIQEGVCKCF